MDEAVSYEEFALVLANHVYDNWYCEEARPDMPPVKTFDTAGENALQITAAILARLKLIEPIEGHPGRYTFLCAPDAFEAEIARNREEGCGYDTLVVAAIGLCEHSAFKKELLDRLARLGVCTYKTSFFDPGKLPQSGLPLDVLKLVRELPRFEIEWTDKKKYYDGLARDCEQPIV